MRSEVVSSAKSSGYLHSLVEGPCSSRSETRSTSELRPRADFANSAAMMFELQVISVVMMVRRMGIAEHVFLNCSGAVAEADRRRSPTSAHASSEMTSRACGLPFSR